MNAKPASLLGCTVRIPSSWIKGHDAPILDAVGVVVGDNGGRDVAITFADAKLFGDERRYAQRSACIVIDVP